MNALSRIFKICDINKDGILDTAELNDFQVRSRIPFGTRLLALTLCRQGVSAPRYSFKNLRASKIWFAANLGARAFITMGLQKQASCISIRCSFSVAG